MIWSCAWTYFHPYFGPNLEIFGSRTCHIWLDRGIFEPCSIGRRTNKETRPRIPTRPNLISDGTRKLFSIQSYQIAEVMSKVPNWGRKAPSKQRPERALVRKFWRSEAPLCTGRIGTRLRHAETRSRLIDEQPEIEILRKLSNIFRHYHVLNSLQNEAW